ncbi:hypothetical protein PAXRUDRAFT_251826 [Paxillus rubicundulus Ve08.2h10]|uniref:Uncharacterized protein n=1 Tax=Paxillus rubicundulus Ve08.2h10 TaxID=930991 RepID=A0A0D0D8I8_9AGAM|nr:hypothetical protein PAXRUDRAFT_251826 [Paxillus rubicundulus Ve08.2h10]
MPLLLGLYNTDLKLGTLSHVESLHVQWRLRCNWINQYLSNHTTLGSFDEAGEDLTAREKCCHRSFPGISVVTVTVWKTKASKAVLNQNRDNYRIIPYPRTVPLECQYPTMINAHAIPPNISLGDIFVKAENQQTGITDDDELKQHILAIQAEAYKIAPYPCIMGFVFIS